ncbi:uncharacterized protein LOC128247878 [Octopus bimaculoides]|uniref:uncharacterized protein LOC128247878 n=1 Tax=Octopus bimaculoides TaxID=37653 RepID=UPI0022E835BD|nr:uncharacterized protein LOC128247878 [Octopus bimaculoides]
MLICKLGLVTCWGLDIPRWVTFSFEVNVAGADICLQENPIELQSDEIFQAGFKDGEHNVWKSNDTATKYPPLWEGAQLYFTAFLLSYLVESGFCHVTSIMSKAINQIDIVETGDLRISLTTLEENIAKLAE